MSARCGRGLGDPPINLYLFVIITPVVVHRRLCSAAGNGINASKRQGTTADEFADLSHRCGLEVSV